MGGPARKRQTQEGTLIPKTAAVEDDLARLTKICLAFPEAERVARGPHAVFIVRKKKFAYYLNDHHGDSRIGVCGRTTMGENEVLVAADPDRFYKPAYIGARGWVGLRLARPDVDWTEVAELVTDSYRLAAPKRLAALVSGPPG